MTERYYNDTGLDAFSYYTYIIEAENAFGKVNSTAMTFRTPAGIPSGSARLTVRDITNRGGTFTWNDPEHINGPLDHYELVSITTSRPNDVTHWIGQNKNITLENLVPFTNYTMRVRICTESGCLDGEPTVFRTLSAEPRGMLNPIVTMVSKSSLKITWSPPTEPNGE